MPVGTIASKILSKTVGLRQGRAYIAPVPFEDLHRESGTPKGRSRASCICILKRLNLSEISCSTDYPRTRVHSALMRSFMVCKTVGWLGWLIMRFSPSHALLDH